VLIPLALVTVLVTVSEGVFAQRGGGAQLGLGVSGGSSSGLGLPSVAGARRARPSSGAARTTSPAVGATRTGGNVYYGPAIRYPYLYSPYAYWSGYAYPQTHYPQTHYARDHYLHTGPHVLAREPRLGLQHNYPYAWTMGLELPVDISPSHSERLPPFQGVVRSQREAERRAKTSVELAAVTDMRAGRYKSAGLALTEGYRNTDDPVYPLLLCEALFALGKHRHAELVLLDALKKKGALGKLPRDVASHFPSKEVFEKKLAALANGDSHKLLTAYLSLFGKNGEDGLEMLLELANGSNAGFVAAAESLYRHHLDKAFGGPEEGEEKAAEPEKAQ